MTALITCFALESLSNNWIWMEMDESEDMDQLFLLGQG